MFLGISLAIDWCFFVLIFSVFSCIFAYKDNFCNSLKTKEYDGFS